MRRYIIDRNTLSVILTACGGKSFFKVQEIDYTGNSKDTKETLQEISKARRVSNTLCNLLKLYFLVFTKK